MGHQAVDWLTDQVYADTPVVVISSPSGKGGLIRHLIGVLGGAPEDPMATLSGDVARVCDVELIHLAATRPGPPIPVRELLAAGTCTKGCLLALGLEADACTCRCRGRYHAALPERVAS